MSAVRREVSLIAAAKISHVAGGGVVGVVRSRSSAVTANCAHAGDARRSTGAGRRVGNDSRVANGRDVAGHGGAVDAGAVGPVESSKRRQGCGGGSVGGDNDGRGLHFGF